MASRAPGGCDLVVDASVFLAAYFPDENSLPAHRIMEEYALGKVNFWAPRLLLLELINACLMVRKRSRIDKGILEKLIVQISSLEINWVDIERDASQIFFISQNFGITAYDAAYIIAAQIKNCKLVTNDLKLVKAVAEKMPFVLFLGNYGG